MPSGKNPRIRQLQNKAKANLNLWARLDVLPDDLNRHPSITPIIDKALGGAEHAIKYLRESSAKEALEVVRIWDLGSKNEHKVIPLEAYCLAAKTTPKVIIGHIMQAVVEHGSIASEMMTAAAQPEIVAKTIKLAKTTKGVDERKAVLQNRGFLPSPKNQVFNNYGNVNNGKQALIGLNQLGEDDDKISLAVDKFNEERLLRSGNEPVIEIVSVVDEE